MGTYYDVKNSAQNQKKFGRIYGKHYKLNKKQFLNDFGQLNTPADVWDSGHVKVGVGDKNFFTKEFMKDLKKTFRCKEH
ncbi:MAG: hypothetical protein AABY22_36700 [Nanoarchaeota archaeon]